MMEENRKAGGRRQGARGCWALWLRQTKILRHLPGEFAAANADATDFRGFLGLKKDFFSVIRGESKGG